jgi:hypothetical protein
MRLNDSAMALLLALGAGSCSSGTFTDDVEQDAAVAGDASAGDAAGSGDASLADAGQLDANVAPDARDASIPDAGQLDANVAPDARDASLADAGQLDANVAPDARDASIPDATADSSVAPDSGATSPTIGGCPIFPSDHIFNTPINGLPLHPSSAQFMATVGNYRIHLDLGQSENMAAPDTYYGIPYNVVHGNTFPWASVSYTSSDTANMTWDPTDESDCAVSSLHTFVSPCVKSAAPAPVLPIPQSVLVEGGIFPDVPSQSYGDHHILLVDADTCRLWEIYHAYTGSGSTWNIFGSASFDLRSNALRPAGWTSADAAGFPIVPLLLRADEASSGTIKHALRFTISSSSIRIAYTWPARHLTTNGSMSTSLPPMGQLFRLKASYVIPSTYSTQSKAILTALKTYGMYLSDGGSNMYIQGEPSANWSDSVFTEVQSVASSQFEAVDLLPIQQRAGFSVDSGAVPPP